MENLEEILTHLPKRHQIALRWFLENKGTIQTWPPAIDVKEGKTLLASKAKGIYKPTWSKYALSVRQSLGGQYPDLEPIIRLDGTWLYPYYQENSDPSARDNEYTNRGLINCLYDGVPIGVMRQVSKKPISHYEILGIALVANWDEGYFFLEGFSSDGNVHPKGPAGEIELVTRNQERLAFKEDEFKTSNIIDAREKAVAAIIKRRGQPEFRNKLLDAYECRCAISECDAVEALEAAHIIPYRGTYTNRVQNGLLLRADLHTLFDLGLITINPVTMQVIIAPDLETTKYAELAGEHLKLPKDRMMHPSVEALRMHYQWSMLEDK
jgi:hypothetical protein